jgi:hypothetical protein
MEYPNGTLVKTRVQLEKKQKRIKKIETFQDRGVGTLEDGLTYSQYVQTCKFFWDLKSLYGLRHQAICGMSYALVARSQQIIEMLFSSIGLVEYENEGPQGAIAMRISIDHSKKNQYERIEHAGCLRYGYLFKIGMQT